MLLEFHALGDHQTESCLQEVVSYKCLKFKNGWRDASSYWLLRKTCFRGGILLPAQISCLRGRHFERSRYKVFQLNIRLQRDGLPLYVLTLLMMRQLMVKVMSAYKPLVVHQAGVHVSVSAAQSNWEYFYSPLDAMPGHYRAIPSIEFTGTIYTPEWREALIHCQ